MVVPAVRLRFFLLSTLTSYLKLTISEGPVQAAVGIIRYLDLKLAGKSEEEYKDFFLSYVSSSFSDPFIFCHNQCPTGT